jgi:uncharacterized repeat protein (TIGR01451 family)
VRKDLPDSGQVGLPGEFIIYVTNLTNFPLHRVVVIETIPNNYQIESSVPDASEITADTATWLLGDFEPNEEKTVRVIGMPTGTGNLSFCTDVDYVLPSCCGVISVTQPALKITKRMPSQLLICDPIPISLVVSNTGTGKAQNVVVEESLPSGLRTVDGKNSLRYDVGSLQPGESREITLDVRADSTGTYENFATVTAANNLAAESNTTTTVVSQPVLNISKTGPEQMYVGLNFSYDIEVGNNGDAPAESTVLEDSIPTNTTFVSASEGGSYANGMVVWNLGTLQPQDYRSLRLTVKGAKIGEERNTATVQASCAEAVAASATTIVRGIPAILLEVVDLQDPILVGSDETYVITVTNQGSATDNNILIEATLEDTMEYVSSSGPTSGILVEGNKVVFDPLPALAPKDKASWKVNVRAINSGDVRFKVIMNSDQIGRDVVETEATNFYQ